MEGDERKQVFLRHVPHYRIFDIVEFVNQHIPHPNHLPPVYFRRQPLDVYGNPVGRFADDAYLPDCCGPGFPVRDKLRETQISYKLKAILGRDFYMIQIGGIESGCSHTGTAPSMSRGCFSLTCDLDIILTFTPSKSPMSSCKPMNA